TPPDDQAEAHDGHGRVGQPPSAGRRQPRAAGPQSGSQISLQIAHGRSHPLGGAPTTGSAAIPVGLSRAGGSRGGPHPCIFQGGSPHLRGGWTTEMHYPVFAPCDQEPEPDAARPEPRPPHRIPHPPHKRPPSFATPSSPLDNAARLFRTKRHDDTPGE